MRAQLEADFTAAYARSPQYRQLDRLELVAGWLLHARQDRPGVVFRSVPQIVQLLGLPYDGTVRDARRRYRNSVANTLGYLADMGWVRSVTPRHKANGEGEGWEIRLGARLAACKVSRGPRSSAGSSDGGSRLPPRRPSHGPGAARDPRRAGTSLFFGEHLNPPSGEDVAVKPVVEVAPTYSERRGERAHHAEPSPAHERWSAHAARRRRSVHAAAALSLAVAVGDDGVGPAARSALAAADEIDAARLMFEALLPDVGPRISAKRQAQLEAAARRIDRYSYPGAWVDTAWRILAAWRAGELAGWISEPPRSLGALAVELRRHANWIRFGALQRRGQADDAARRRQVSKRWRRELRALEHEHPGGGRSLRRPRDLGC